MTEQLWDVARTLRSRVRTFFDPPLGPTASPLELLQAALDEIEARAQPRGRGSKVFPYTHVVVHVAQTGTDRAAIEAVFGQLDARLRERLAEIRCEIPPVLVASVVVSDDTSPDGPVMRVECGNGRDPSSASGAATGIPELRILVVKGDCEHSEYAFTGGVVSIGRGAEPSDALGRVRRNDVAFGDVRDGVTETVGRAHARLEFEPVQRAYLLFNESNSNPTFVLRGGRCLPVTPRDRRGVRVRSGDDVQLGRALVRITVGA